MYDCTFYVENDFDVSIAHWLKGNPSTITLVCSRIDLSEIPTDPDESKAYLYQLFHEKVKFHHSIFQSNRELFRTKSLKK